MRSKRFDISEKNNRFHERIKENMNLYYKIFAKFYDIIDIVYFRDFEKSPRKALLDAITGNEKILDLCTGTAANAIALAKVHTKIQIMGVDLSGNMLRVAKNKVKRAGLKNIRLYQMDATDLKFKDGCFDKILLSLVLHELDETLAGKILKEAKRILKPDGEIIITEWEPSRHPLKKLLFMPIHILEPKPYHDFVKKDLYSYFGDYRLKIHSIKHCNYTKVITLKKCEHAEKRTGTANL